MINRCVCMYIYIWIGIAAVYEHMYLYEFMYICIRIYIYIFMYNFFISKNVVRTVRLVVRIKSLKCQSCNEIIKYAHWHGLFVCGVCFFKRNLDLSSLSVIPQVTRSSTSYSTSGQRGFQHSNQLRWQCATLILQGFPAWRGDET